MVSLYYTFDPAYLTPDELAKIEQAKKLFAEVLQTRPASPYAEMVKGICDNGTGKGTKG